MTDWQAIVNRHGPAVWRTAWRLLTHDADAADCYQETFLAAVKLVRRQPVRDWPSLLKHLATARALARLRHRVRQRSRRELPLDSVELTAANPGPVELAEAAELDERFRAAVSRLPAQQATAFWLKTIEKLTYEQIAQQMKIKPNAVGVLIHRARKRLQHVLEDTEANVSVK